MYVRVRVSFWQAGNDFYSSHY